MVAYIVDIDTGCWVWQGAKNSKGYALLWTGKFTISAYRAAYLLHHGPIPEGMEVDHTCKNRLCVNPAHLEAVTREENIRRQGQTKLNVEAVNEIRRLAGIVSQGELADRFGVTQACVSLAALGKSWTSGEGLLPPLESFEYRRGKISFADAEEIRRLVASGIPQKDVAVRFGLSRPNVSQIVRGMSRVRQHGHGLSPQPETV